MATFQKIGPTYCPKCKTKRKKKICEICGEKTKISGKWSVVFDLPSEDGKRYQKRLSGFSTKKEAELAYVAFKNTNKKSIAPILSVELFKDAYEHYMTYQKTRIKESSFIDIQSAFKTQILPFFGAMELQKIHSKDVIAWQSELNKKGLSYKYKYNLLGYLKSFFNYCVFIEESISTSPAKRQLKFIRTAVKKEMLIYDPSEYMRFRSVINDPRDLIIFDLLYFTGMRKGELMALLWQDLKQNILSVTKSYTRKTADKKWKITTPKSKNSIRDIMLPNFLVSELNEYKEQFHVSDSDYLIGTDLPISERYLDAARDKYYKAAQIKRIRLHDFRHSHVSYLISENIDVVSIAKRVGDKLETVLSTYAHLMPNKQQEMIKKLENLFLLV